VQDMSTGQSQRQEVNKIRHAVVVHAFKDNVGQRALILIGPFPFLVIGKITEVNDDFVFITVETTHIDELEGRVLRIHIDDVEVFFIEDGNHSIPRIPR
jgi:hypothetical protein